MYLLGFPRELTRLASNPVIEPHPHRNQQIRLLDGQAGVGHAVHSGHSHAKDVIVRKRADAEQGRDDWNLRLLRQLPELVVCAGESDSMTRQYDRLLRLVDQLHGLLDLAAVTLQRRLIARQIDLQTVVELVEGRERQLDLFHLHIFRHVDDDRAGPACAGDVEGLLHHLRDFDSVHHQGVVLGNREGNASRVGLLECVRTDGSARDLSNHCHHRHRIHLRGGNARYEVGRARPRRRPADAHLAAHARVAVRSMRRALLMPS